MLELSHTFEGKLNGPILVARNNGQIYFCYQTEYDFIKKNSFVLEPTQKFRLIQKQKEHC